MKKHTKDLRLLKLKADGSKELDNILDIKGFESYANSKLSDGVSAFFSRGAGSGFTLEENAEKFNDIKLLPRVLRDVGERSLSTNVLGQDLDFPLLIAPMAFQRLAHPEGEVAVVRAAHEHNVPMVVSTLSTYSFEEIRINTNISPWLQLYIYKDREISRNLIQMAENSNYKGIVLTVDAPLYGKRIKELSNPVNLPVDFEVKNLQEAGLNLRKIDSNKLLSYLSSLLNPSVTWDDIAWIRSMTPLPIVLKGIINPKDIQIAIESSIDGIIISNHGGRQLDTTLSSIEALKLSRNIIDGRIDVILDGGIRKGVDMLKALALGAKAVMVGRPIIWGLASGGEEGVKRVLNILKSEFELAMALSGYASVDQINDEILWWN